MGVEARDLRLRRAAGYTLDAAAMRTGGRPPFRRWMREIGWRHLVALAGVLFVAVPVYFVVVASVGQSSGLQGQDLVPRDATLKNYRSLLTTQPFLLWMKNSMVVAGTAAIANTMLSAMAAYAFSRLRFTGRRVGLMTILLVQMFPQLLAMVAIFLFMVNVKAVFPAVGLGTHLGLILVYLGGALGTNTWLMKGFFDTIPSELDEAARVDGATHGQLFTRIILPLAAPILAVTGLLSFIFLFNEFILASVLINDTESYTLAVGLSFFILKNFGQQWGPFAAGALMGGIPIIILFLFLQRYISSGLTAGSVKG